MAQLKLQWRHHPGVRRNYGLDSPSVGGHQEVVYEGTPQALMEMFNEAQRSLMKELVRLGEETAE